MITLTFVVYGSFASKIIYTEFLLEFVLNKLLEDNNWDIGRDWL